MEVKEKLSGIGGWLILPAIGICLNPFFILFNAVPIYQNVLQPGIWEALTSSSSQSFHPLWAPLLISEIVFNATIFIITIIVIFLFFTKHQWFPRVYIIMMLLSVIIPFFDSLASKMIPYIASLNQPIITNDHIRVIVGAAIWIPYMLFSERVHNTFKKEVQSDTDMETTSGVIETQAVPKE